MTVQESVYFVEAVGGVVTVFDDVLNLFVTFPLNLFLAIVVVSFAVMMVKRLFRRM